MVRKFLYCALIADCLDESTAENEQTCQCQRLSRHATTGNDSMGMCQMMSVYLPGKFIRYGIQST
jgi:hypothetical protein